LLNRLAAASTDIHPQDLSDLLSRFGIDLIADGIEAEGSVVDLLDYDLRFGQGFLFSPPRPVRAEALQGAEPAKPDAADQAKRDGAPSRGGLAQLARTGSSRT
jgi:cyclic-di-GMP phosphodiesterase, flagellum assembly factor TipF